jgi:Fur family ferric uptake transcriptional regulator
MDAQMLADKLVERGHRLTRARQEILAALAASGGHVTADDLAAQVNARAPEVGRMTVYRTLDLLTDLGLARPIFQGTGAAHYVLMPEGSHHHLICNSCQQVIEFEDCTADDLLAQLAAQFNFAVRGHLLEVHGLCQDCHAQGVG